MNGGKIWPKRVQHKGTEEWKEAQEELHRAEDAALSNPKDAKAFVRLAAALYSLDRIAEAIKMAEVAIWLDGRLADAHYVRGVAYWRKSASDEPLDALDRRITGIQRAKYTYLKSSGAEAWVSLEEAIYIDNSHQNAWRTMVYFSSGHSGDWSHGRDAMKKNPDNPALYVGKGRANALAARGYEDAIEAIEALERGAELDPDYPRVHTMLGGVLLALERTEDALEALERAVKADPADAIAHIVMWGALGRLGRDEEAGHALQKARKLDPRAAERYFDSIWKYPTANRSPRPEGSRDEGYYNSMYDWTAMVSAWSNFEKRKDSDKLALMALALTPWPSAY